MDQLFSSSRLGHILWTLYEEVAPTLEPPVTPKHSVSDVDDWSNDAFYRYFRALEQKNDHQIVKCLTDHTTLKLSRYPSELPTLQLIATHTSIPVPHIRRKLKWAHFAMEHIPGIPLHMLWPNLSWPQRLEIAFTIRSYVQQLRTIHPNHPRSSIPGPLAPGTLAVKSDTPMWGEIRGPRGPFASYAALSTFFNDRVAIAVRAHKNDNVIFRRMGFDVPDGDPPISYADVAFDDSEPLVFCHMDIQRENFIVGDDGALWMIGWGRAGFYPRWFEYVAAGVQSEGLSDDTPECEDWKSLIPLMCGMYHEQDAWYFEWSRGLSFP